ncbi:MAG: hypothetical protein RLZZ262_800 [Bacteroidota bacterium]|jgi:dinuclear metal center YbgI/SA1388 family protein
MKISEVIQCLEAWAPPALQESYDNSGLICGSTQHEISGCLVTLDVTEEVVDEAIRLGLSLIIAHHPFVFSGIKKLTGRDWVQRTLIKAIKNDIAIYAIHTNLDHIHTGVNRRIGDLLGLQNLRVLEPKEGQMFKIIVFAPESVASQVKSAMTEAGAGQIGSYKDCAFVSTGEGYFRPTGDARPAIGELDKLEKVTEHRIEVLVPGWLKDKVLQAAKAQHCYEEMAYYVQKLENTSHEFGSGMIGEWQEGIPMEAALAKIKSTFGGVVRFTRGLNKPIQKVAFCGGSGSFLLSKARSSGADLFLTADFKYHQFFDAEDKIVIADIGHFEIEQFTSQLIVDHLKQKFTTFAPQITTVNTNPVGYY